MLPSGPFRSRQRTRDGQRRSTATVWWFVARHSYGTPTTADYGDDREQAELAEGIV